MNNKIDPSVDAFNRDVERIGSYVYTSGQQLSSRLATGRTTQLIVETKALNQKKIADIGCGDGYFTNLFDSLSRPTSIIGLDAAFAATLAAAKSSALLNRSHNGHITFLTGDAHYLPYQDNSFDVALLQSVLHHDSDPLAMIKEAFRIAPQLLIHEPNGNSPILKLFEKVMPYHREHKERSYATTQLRQWIHQAGGVVTYQRFAGFVPMFVPDWVAKAAKFIEPMVEYMPGIATIGCAVTIIVAERGKYKVEG